MPELCIGKGTYQYGPIMSKSKSAVLKTVPRPTRRTQVERSTETREQLIWAAVECIMEKGFFGTSMAAIAQKAGLTRGALQHHFRSVDELFLAVIEKSGNDLVRLAAQPLSSGNSLEKRVASFIRSHMALFTARDFLASLQIWLGMGKNPAVQLRLKNIMLQFEEEIDLNWRKNLRDFGVSPRQIGLMRRVTLSCLRGLAIRSLYLQETRDWTDELSLLKKMFSSVLVKRHRHK